MSKSRFGYGAMAITGVLMWHLSHAETENPGTLDRGNQAGAETMSGLIQDGQVILGDLRNTAGGLVADVGGGIEGAPPPAQPQLPVQIDPNQPNG